MPSSSVNMERLKGGRSWTHVLTYMSENDVYT